MALLRNRNGRGILQKLRDLEYRFYQSALLKKNEASKRKIHDLQREVASLKIVPKEVEAHSSYKKMKYGFRGLLGLAAVSIAAIAYIAITADSSIATATSSYRE